MEKSKKGFLDRISSISTLTKNGLFLHGLRNNLARLGIDLMPYYWEIGSTDIETPKIRDDESLYKVSFFDVEELTYVKQNIIGIGHKNLIADLQSGDICLGIKKNEKIAIYSFIRSRDFEFRGRQFKIKPNEGYVCNTYTFEDFRGKNLAPYLRCQSYKLLKEKGIDTYYSISEYLNTPTLRYKRKLNVKPIQLFLSVILFKRWQFNFTLKNYK